MDGDTGFCGTILGTLEYQERTAKISALLQSSNCHTEDREDFQSMNDQCSIAKSDEWEDAIKARYEINYWPYVNAKEEVRECLERMFKDSPTNMGKIKLDSGRQLVL